jgi:hypothetical protein
MPYTEVHINTSNAIDQLNPSFSIQSAPFVDRFKILRCVIPAAYQSTDISNNQVVFFRAGNTRTATIPPGNYTSVTFPTALQTALNEASDIGDFLVSYDHTTRRLTITADSAFRIGSFLDGTTAYSQLGMSRFEQPPTNDTVSFGVADFTAYAPLLLTSSSLVSKSIVYANEENINVLAMIDMNAPQNSMVTYINENGSWLNSGVSLSNMNLKLLNARTLLPVRLSQPYSVSIAILTDPRDHATH